MFNSRKIEELENFKSCVENKLCNYDKQFQVLRSAIDNKSITYPNKKPGKDNGNLLGVS